ncbi:Fe3+ hydroxamate ABC transporter substrate-binding protein [Rossellomorea sp. BNER]|nr:Fe3+ hydroxamate ABC transporter substrate-binding protein [Rossellomorea sp. BNER]
MQTPTCMGCNKEVKGNDEVYVKMRYPERRGRTEIRAFLQNEGKFLCNDCYIKR